MLASGCGLSCCFEDQLFSTGIFPFSRMHEQGVRGDRFVNVSSFFFVLLLSSSRFTKTGLGPFSVHPKHRAHSGRSESSDRPR